MAARSAGAAQRSICGGEGVSRAAALFGSGLFLMLAPGTVAGLLPWVMSHWRFGPLAHPALMAVAAAIIAVSAVALTECFVRFAWTAAGTPAPAAPTRRLVVTGLYRRTRNPMYVGMAILLLAWAVHLSAWLPFAGILAFVLYITRFQIRPEERALQRIFGEAFSAYCARVRRWL